MQSTAVAGAIPDRINGVSTFGTFWYCSPFQRRHDAALEPNEEPAITFDKAPNCITWVCALR